MKRLQLFLAVITFIAYLMPTSAFAQGTVKGILTDQAGDALIGANIYIVEHELGTTTDIDGMFSFSDVPTGAATLRMTYIGFEEMTQSINVTSGMNDIGSVALDEGALGLEEVLITADVAIDRRTPVAATTIKGADIEVTVGNQEFPEVLRKTPSVYVTKQGGGFGDSRINVRGFNQRNVAVMINGIPVNDMENGWVYWSNWAGLSDVTSNLQIQRGLGASKLAVSSVGGSINIMTNAADMNKGGSASVSIGNDGYNKYSLAYNTGLSEKGWAFSLLGSHTKGDGYVDGTKFRAWSYFASATKQFSEKSQLSLTVVGAPQWHHQRNFPSRFDRISLRTFNDPDNTGEAGTNLGSKFNWVWGELDGEEFSFRRNFYHKPKTFLNYYLQLSPKTELKASAYYSAGRGGGTGPRGRLRTPGSVFDSFSGLGVGLHNDQGQIRFDDIVRYNQGQAVEGWGGAADRGTAFGGQNIISSDGRYYFPDGSRSNGGSGFIRRASMNSHNWMGLVSTLSTDLTSNWNLTVGIDARRYKGIHYRRLENLLGADGYLSRSNDNNPENIITQPSEAEFGNFSDNSYEDTPGNVLNYWNDGLVNWAGVFTQLEYNNDKISAFVSLSGSNQGFKRIDYFNYLNSDPDRETDWQNFLGGTVKAGMNINLDDKNNIYFNAGIYSQQPLFDNVFLNFRNDVNPDIKNQEVKSFELGYGFKSRNFKAKLNLYTTNWGNRQFDRTSENALGEDLLFQFTGVDQSHSGLEAEFDYRASRKLSFFSSVTMGDWKYGSDFSASGFNLDTQVPEGNSTLLTDGLRVGDAAQQIITIGAKYEIAPGLRIYADYTSFDNLYGDYDVADVDPGEQITVAKLPSYGLMDAGVSYKFDLGKNAAIWSFNINNLLDEVYVSEIQTNIVDNPATPNVNEFYDNRGVFGFGTTWNTRLKINF